MSGNDDPPAVTTLVVQSHPLDSSYSAALRERVVAALDQVAEPNRAFRLASGERPGRAELVSARRLILVYPTWSGGLPASLLAWVHELLDRGGSLTSITELVAVTSCGSSRLVNLVQGEWGRDLLRTRVLDACAPGARFTWLALYKVDRRSEAEMAEHLGSVQRRITTLIRGRGAPQR